MRGTRQKKRIRLIQIKRSARKRTAEFLLLAFFTGIFCQMFQTVTAFAATKPITTVNIKVDAKLEPGEKLPEIEIGGSAEDGGVTVSSSNSKYSIIEAEWTDKSKSELKVSEEPQMRVTLEPADVSEYYFPATYKSSSVKISNGTFVSARRDGDNLIVSLRIKSIKGEFGQSEEAFWNENSLGQARWEKPENTSGYYELLLYRDRKQVYHVSQTSSLQYNFYPYMTKAGDYTFKVRTIPVTSSQKKYGEKGEWTESGELSISDRYVSDGKGQQNSNASSRPGTTETVGWVKENGSWMLRLPDGRLCRQEWYLVDGLWYHFDGEGRMQTGWIQENGQWFYLHPDGQMAVGWTKINGQWYYLYPWTENGHIKGAMAGSGWIQLGAYFYYINEDGSMYKGWLNQNGKWYYLNAVENSLEGAMLTGWIHRNENTYFTNADGSMAEGWYQIDGSWYYFRPGSGEMARNTQIDGFYVDGDGIWR